MSKNNSGIFAERLSNLQSYMQEVEVDLVAIAPTPNMRYLLGFAPLHDERPCALLVRPDKTSLVVPQLNADEVESHTGLEAIRWTDAEGPDKALSTAFKNVGVKPGGVLAADDTMRADVLMLFQEMIEPSQSIPASEVIGPLRMRKSEEEVEGLQRAAEMADKAVLVGVEAIRAGVTEREVAEKIANYFSSQGADSVAFTIVSSGPNGAFPHHLFSDRVIEDGDMIVVDIGAPLNGYQSDVTRMVHVGEPTDEERSVYDLVLEANTKGREAAMAGGRARDVDAAARTVISEAGYGPNFLHRTGHGLGLEVHEPPWITGESDTVLEPGMVFSVEPGVYLQGKFGVRIEDIVMVTENGECHCFTGLERELIIR